MTENEIIENLDDIWTFGHEPADEERLAANKAIDLIQEIQQYRAIGTVEECREAMKRRRANKPVLSAPCKSINYYLCPNCNKILNINKPFCCDCGSGIDWSEEDV